MCDKSAFRDPTPTQVLTPVLTPTPALPKSAEQLMEEFNKLRKGTYMAFQEDYLR